ncbi:MAG: HAD family phosphatase [Clostridia bacterium]|nr:HAD family phosphatase [Clostridia bacterium]
MIKNVIFDFGQVLVHFVPKNMVAKVISDKNDAGIVEQIMFDRCYWDKLDAGTVSDDEVVADARTRLPERLWADAEKIYRDWIYNCPETEGMREILHTLKEKGIHLFLLSNISKTFAEHEEANPILSEFEGKVFSSLCGMTKPNPEIFRYVCRIFSLLPEETVFVDDSEKNIKGAESVGIKGYLFDGDVEKLSAFLSRITSR